MTDLHKNEKIEKAKETGIFSFDTHMELLTEFHDRLTKLEKRFPEREPFYEVNSLFRSARKNGERLANDPTNTINKNPGESEPHLGMIDLDAFSKLQAENMDLRQEIVKISNMFWDEVKASLLWKQKYETSYNELRALKMATK